MQSSRQVYDRKAGTTYTDVQYGGGFLKTLYGTAFGKLIMPVMLSTPVSKIGGIYTDTFLSRMHIGSFIRKNNINMEEYEERKFRSLNDFFTRKVKEGRRPVAEGEDVFVAPADSKLSVYPISSDSRVLIKGNEYSVADLVGSKEVCDGYHDGLCLVFRLSVDDYHRYAFPADGTVVSYRHIKGRLHTVCDISSAHRVYQENSRVVSILQTKAFEEMIMIEVGALMVGRIVNHKLVSFRKGQEKGYFRLGGSTIVVLVNHGKLTLDEDITEHVGRDAEVRLRYGERVGRAT
ncbi:MAG: phosphatidylserine decarboxylase [Clostridiales bacterium]|nr:phosphatidylserine decarboxylase [Clostridiales bacterium]